LDIEKRPIVHQNLCEKSDHFVARYAAEEVCGNNEYHISQYDEFEQYMRQNKRVKYLWDEVVLIHNRLDVIARDDKMDGNRMPIEKVG
jgi:hypothetical protein